MREKGMGGEPDNRWFHVGRSSDADARAAGRQAAASALGGRPDPKLLVVFASSGYDLQELAKAASGTVGNTPVIGCSTAGEIAGSGPGSGGVVVAAFGGPGFEATTALAEGAGRSLRDAGARAAACVDELPDRKHRALLLLTDGLAGDQQEIVRGAYSVVGAGIPMVGGCAGDDLKMARTFQICDDRVVSDGVVATCLGSDEPIGIGVRHGWRRAGEPMLITRSAARCVFEIDEKPALDVYLDRLDAPDEVRTDPAAFTRFASTHPLGLVARAGESHVRFIGEADFDERALVSIAEVPQGGLAWLMEGDAESVLDASVAACEDAFGALGGRDPLGVLAFDCIARRGVLGAEGIRTEIARIAGHREVPVAGFYTYGEIARTRGVSGFHNQTLVVLAVS